MRGEKRSLESNDIFVTVIGEGLNRLNKSDQLVKTLPLRAGVTLETHLFWCSLAPAAASLSHGVFPERGDTRDYYVTHAKLKLNIQRGTACMSWACTEAA